MSSFIKSNWNNIIEIILSNNGEDIELISNIILQYKECDEDHLILFLYYMIENNHGNTLRKYITERYTWGRGSIFFQLKEDGNYNLNTVNEIALKFFNENVNAK